MINNPDLKDNPPSLTEEQVCNIGQQVGEATEAVTFLGLLNPLKEGEIVFGSLVNTKDLEALQVSPIADLVSELLFKLADSELSSIFYFKSNHENLHEMNVKGKRKRMAWTEIVPFGCQKVNNVHNTTINNRQSNWIRWWELIVSNHPERSLPCGVTWARYWMIADCTNSRGIVGGHMQLSPTDGNWYMLPICRSHNSKKHDAPAPPLTTREKALAIKFPPLLPGPDLNPFFCREQSPSLDVVSDLFDAINIKVKDAGEAMTNDLMHLVQDVASKAKNNTENFLHHEKNKIMGISLIPFYGWAKAIDLISKLEKRAKKFFSTRLQTLLADLMHSDQFLQLPTKYKDQAIQEIKDSTPFSKLLKVLRPGFLQSGDTISIQAENGLYLKRFYSPKFDFDTGNTISMTSTPSIFSEFKVTVLETSLASQNILIQAENGLYLKRYYLRKGYISGQNGQFVSMAVGTGPCSEFTVTVVDSSSQTIHIQVDDGLYLRRFYSKQLEHFGMDTKNTISMTSTPDDLNKFTLCILNQ